MKRTASDAFQPDGVAFLDPKVYFQQWQQHCFAASSTPSTSQSRAGSTVGTEAVGLATALGHQGSTYAASTTAAPTEKSEVMQQVEEASAVKCATIVKEKGANFTTAVALEAFNTMATKSSFKLREELCRQPQVKRLCKRVQGLLAKPPPGISFEMLSRAAWNMVHFPEEVRGDAQATMGPTANSLGASQASDWKANSAARIIWSLAKAEVIAHYKPLVSQVVAELVAFRGRRIKELTDESLIGLQWAIARARRYVHEGDHPTVHAEANDELLFELAANRVIENVERMDARLLADLVNAHAEIGIRNEPLFKALCPRLVDKQKEIRDDIMGKVIKAYARFMIPLRHERQGFRTMATVSKGDFIRPSDKPKKQGRRVYDHPVSLYDATQLHTRG
mmetsp:Transcript_88806/g.176541  ORF Transcript_88806/g.176541 Transcript_88806/m.176541 type:complete len:393 (+) Transcript_88806:72-1250(+)